MDNFTIADRLLNAAHTLEDQQANLYRVRAYRRAAQVIRGLDRPVEDLLTEAGRKALRNLPGIGTSLSTKIETLVRTGDFPILKEADTSTLVTMS
jgi:DNA polymerase/3'-5' exonuclease PolX